MSHARVGRWGKSLAVRLPTQVAAMLGLQEGDRVEVLTRDGEAVVRRLEPALTAESLFKGRSPDEWRALYEDSYDWGPDLGREIVGE